MLAAWLLSLKNADTVLKGGNLSKKISVFMYLNARPLAYQFQNETGSESYI